MSARERERAFRLRKGVIGLLECCTCGYPIAEFTSATGHDENCQAHAMTLSARAAGRDSGFAWVSVDEDAAELGDRQ
jgi:hypothetical protein